MTIDLTALLVTVFLLAIFTILAVIGIKIIFRKFSELSSQNRLLKAIRSLDELALSNIKAESLFQGIVDVIHKELGFTFAVIALLDKEAKSVRRVAISLNQESAADLDAILPVKVNQQVVSLSNRENLFTRVIFEKKAFYTENLVDIQKGVLPEEVSKEIQQGWHLKTIFLYPILRRGEIIGLLEYASTKAQKKHSALEMMIMEAFTQEASRVLDNVFLYQDLKQTSNKLTTANMALKELDKLKDDFVSVASHELRTPMTAIRTYVWLLLYKSDSPLTPKQKMHLERTLKSTERLISLVNDMLNVSRIEAGRIEINPKPFNILDLTKEVMEEVRPKADEQTVKLQITDKQLPPVFADADKVHQVLLNLVGNSLKFTPKNGIISVDFNVNRQMIEISVKDTGVGISKENMAKLFSKFGRLENSYVQIGTSGGTGLGLYISKSLIELMHGKIWAASAGTNQGSTFTFSLPIASAEILRQAERYHIKPQGEVKELEPAAI